MAEMRRTKNATAGELMHMLTAAEKAADDMRLMLALIAYLQEDKIFTVSIPDLKSMPNGSSVDISFNKVLQQYEFKYVAPGEPPLAPEETVIHVAARRER
jgi:hypothetical protein